jgi:hypothetical protein
VLREFICTGEFDKCWTALGLDDEDLKDLQNELLGNPQAGDVIKKTGGARKIRIAAKGHGKRGGARVIYVDILVHKKIYLLVAYPKGQKDNLSDAEKNSIALLIHALKDQLSGGT